MIRVNREDIYPKFVLKVFKDDKVVKRVITTNKSVFNQKLSLTCKVRIYKKFILKVIYGEDIINEGIFTKPNELKTAYHAFLNVCDYAKGVK